MGPLDNARRELFAQALARGRTLNAAYVEAGYQGGHQGSPSRLKRQPEVQARVAELLGQSAPGARLDKSLLVHDLMRLARKAEALDTPSSLGAARLALLAAAKLDGEIPPPRTQLQIDEDLSHEEWLEKYGPGSEYDISRGY